MKTTEEFAWGTANEKGPCRVNGFTLHTLFPAAAAAVWRPMAAEPIMRALTGLAPRGRRKPLLP